MEFMVRVELDPMRWLPDGYLFLLKYNLLA